MSGCEIMRPVGVRCDDATTAVRSGSGRADGRCRSAATSASNPRMRSASPAPTRFDEPIAASREHDVADHRPGLLAQAGLIESVHLPAVEHRGGRQDLGDGDDAGAADPGEAEPDTRSARRWTCGSGTAVPPAGSVGAVGRWPVPTSTVMNAGQSPWRQLSSRSCTMPGRSSSCGRVVSRSAAPTGSC